MVSIKKALFQNDLRAEFMQDIPDELLQVETAGTFESEEQAQKWLDQVQMKFPSMTVSYTPLPCSIACHVGMNAAGVGIMKKGVGSEVK